MAISNLIPLIAALVYVLLLLVVLISRPWQKMHQLFVLYLAAATLWGFSTFLLLSPFFIEYKLYLFRLVILSSAWWVVQLYHFARFFLRLPGGGGVWFGYTSLLLLMTLAALGFAPPSIIIADGAFVGPSYGWWYVFYIAPLVSLAVMGIYSLVRRLRILTDPEERNKISYLIAAVLALAVFGFVGISPLALVAGLPWAHVGGLASACIFAYAIMKHELVSINTILRRGLGWASLLSLSAGAYLVLFYLFHLLFGFTLEAVVVALATVGAVGLALLVYWLRPVFLVIVDQLFYRGTYPYRQTLFILNTKMANMINLSELADQMLPAISKALRISRARLLFEDASTGDFTTQFTYPKTRDIPQDTLKFSFDSPIIDWLETENVPLDLKQIDSIPQFKGLWQIERERLAASNLELLCPIKSRGKLIGILALSKKQSGNLYSHDDIEVLMSMVSQAGIVIENARMFDKLKKQQQQMEQLLNQIVMAQETERQRISIDLHDSVAQWLAATSYRAQTASRLLKGNGDERVQTELANVESTIDKSLKELRRVLIGLRPPALDELGLTHALQQSLEELKADGILCQFSEMGTPVRLASSTEIAVYRIVQEALANIRKHADASKVNLRLFFEKGKLVTEIRDDGRGFDLSQTLDSAVVVGRMGLLGMKQRVEMLGGEIRIKTAEGSGTAIILSLPIQSREEGG
ncbi:MAG: histidine kinase [Dehalococcoidales bacterium]|nr:histidine kinase [Dehalococcoidales bacterium]